jgi:hypothetical protein
MFAATVGEDDVRLFKYHVKEDNEIAEENKKAGRKGKEKKWTGTIIEIPVERDINFEWSHTNLEHGIDEGRKAAKEAFTRYSDLMGRGKDKDKLEILGADDRETRTKRRRDRLIKAGQARH